MIACPSLKRSTYGEPQVHTPRFSHHVAHHRLNIRLAGCNEWTEFTGTSTIRKILRGFGNIEDNVLNFSERSAHAAAVRSIEHPSEFGFSGSQTRVRSLDGNKPSPLMEALPGR